MTRAHGLAVVGGVALLLGGLGGLSTRWAAAQPAPKRPPDVNKVAEFMRQKLDHSQDALEGLCTEDFTLLQTAAEKMIEMSRATEWVVIGGPRYAEHSDEFRAACEQLAKAARNKNLDAAALAWLKVTMDCLECHQFVRKTRVASVK
jgi:cytochrome c556